MVKQEVYADDKNLSSEDEDDLNDDEGA
jgi:hypothetical protein